MAEENILTIKNRKEEAFLHARTKSFSFPRKGEIVLDGRPLGRAEIHTLLLRMRRAMRDANGIGLSANQIGLPYKLFVAEVPTENGEKKAYAVFNPVVEKASKEKETLEEGCLSIPGIYGEVPRHQTLTLRGFDRYGKPLTIKARGLLARVFQHEVDHLEGKLFTDRASRTYEMPKSDRLRERETNR